MTARQSMIVAFVTGAACGHFLFSFTVAILGGLVGQWLYETFVKSAV